MRVRVKAKDAPMSPDIGHAAYFSFAKSIVITILTVNILDNSVFGFSTHPSRMSVSLQTSCV